MTNYYEILKAPSSASASELRAAYLRLSVSLHPDRNKAPDAHAQFCDLQRAWEVLRDPQSRAAYDRSVAPVANVWLEVRGDELKDLGDGEFAFDCHCGCEFVVDSDDFDKGKDLAACYGCSRYIRILSSPIANDTSHSR